jgi:lysophospholipase L1-like esterase
MTRLAALLRARGIPLTIVVYPWPHQLIWEDRSSVQVTYWRDWAAREQTGFIELFTTFFAEADAMGTSEALARYFIEDDIHWTADGHRLVAVRVAPDLAIRP